MSTTTNTVTFGDVMPAEINAVITACEAIVQVEAEADASVFDTYHDATVVMFGLFSTLSESLEALRVAAGFSENVAHSVVLQAASRFYSDDDRPAALKAGSSQASNLKTWERYHNDEAWERFVASCQPRITDEGGYLKMLTPTMRRYCSWLLAAFDKDTRDKGYVLNEHDRRTSPDKDNTDDVVDVGALKASFHDAALKMPSRFVIGEYTLKEIKALAAALSIAVELSTHGVTVSDIKALAVAES